MNGQSKNVMFVIDFQSKSLEVISARFEPPNWCSGPYNGPLWNEEVVAPDLPCNIVLLVP